MFTKQCRMAVSLVALAGIGYSFGWGDVVAAWRYLDYDMPGDSALAELNFNGPMVGVALDW